MAIAPLLRTPTTCCHNNRNKTCYFSTATHQYYQKQQKHRDGTGVVMPSSLARPQEEAQRCPMMTTTTMTTATTTTAPSSSSSSPSPPQASWPPGMLEPPRVLANGIEVSVHACTRSMAREVKHIFPHLKPKAHTRASSTGGGQPQQPQQGQYKVEGGLGSGRGEDEVLIVPTIQRSRVDTVRFGPEAEAEKDRCLEYFADFAKPLCQELRALGHWADYIDPCSGLPVLTPHCTRPYSEVAGFEHLLRYKTQNAGCCKILLHPRWGSSCYPATLFTTAPLPALVAAVRRREQAVSAAAAAEQQQQQQTHHHHQQQQQQQQQQ